MNIQKLKYKLYKGERRTQTIKKISWALLR